MLGVLNNKNILKLYSIIKLIIHMKYLTILALAFTFVFTSCNDETELPICIDTILDDFKQDACSGADFTIWRFRGEDVYCFSYTSCFADGQAEIYDANCDQLCLLGGIAGNTDCVGIDWESNAVLQETFYIQP